MKHWFSLDVHSYLKYIQEKEHLDRVWGYYKGLDTRYRAEVKKLFLEYLLINSCVIIFVILSFQNVGNGIEILTGTKEKCSDPNKQRYMEFSILYQYITKDRSSVKREMLSMCCQIPWFVVEAVYIDHSNLMKDVGTPITDLALSCFGDLYPGVHESKVHDGIITPPPGGYKHLLHMFHWSRTPEGKYLVETRSILEPIKTMDNFYIPSATDLQLSATVFKKHAGSSIDVSYSDRRLSGEMQLAPWHIFTYSNQIYANLLRFEQEYVDCGYPVTAYVACMVCLLQSEADVRLLQANGIVPSTGNDEKAVLSFVHEFKLTPNELLKSINGLNILSNYFRMPNDLNILLEKVRAHREKSATRYYGEFKMRYCSNPWITISVVAAVCLFVLTFIQTLYGTLSYYKQ